jgi:hypothetical protein
MRIKVFSAIISLVMILSLTGCGFMNLMSSRIRMLNEEMKEEKSSNSKTTKALIDCFNEKDFEKLKTLFCVKSRNLEDIDQKIFAAFNLFQGKVVSYDENDLSGYEGASSEYGKKIKLDRAWSVNDILPMQVKPIDYLSIQTSYTKKTSTG